MKGAASRARLLEDLIIPNSRMTLSTPITPARIGTSSNRSPSPAS